MRGTPRAPAPSPYPALRGPEPHLRTDPDPVRTDALPLPGQAPRPGRAPRTAPRTTKSTLPGTDAPSGAVTTERPLRVPHTSTR
ncbi:hypothetical protein GCM10010358_29910 [Streptomyces minutiscleroticus]|uniref:Uncharacterized protein n=1 Tax=Streptomyces minutiscleroticus TaxID=68238 RepID=A0A918KTY6_9ACTN|nr:hypothetical protein GCM10010358_29910 [Streptomyces minutiscleroticus]